MEQDQPDLEEGEIEDDDEVVNVYTPLERPINYALDAPNKRFAEVSTHYSDNDDESQSSESDSDSDTGVKVKKQKRIKIPKKPLPKRQDKAKKYDIWSTRAQEDILAETMISCDVSLKDRSRDVESYDYTIARELYDEQEEILENKQGIKRTRDNMNTFKCMPKKHLRREDKAFKGTPKQIPDLNVNETSSVSEIVKEIASKLNEKRDDLILKVVDTMGKKRVIEIFQETRQIESEGGMPIMNQTRRRTPGGVFLYLVRTDYHITPEQKKQIFDEDKQQYKQLIKEKKKKKHEELKKTMKLERSKILPELLTRAELYSNKTNIKTEEENCTNPPPSPESDHQESIEAMPIEENNVKKESDHLRGELKTYDDDYLDISCENDMDFF